jgi:Flp pilus assembly protein TadG
MDIAPPGQLGYAGLRRVGGALGLRDSKGIMGSSGSCSTHPSDERGASLVEFVLVLPILLALLFGMVTGGQALSRDNSLKNAAREGARYGATLPVSDMSSWLADVTDVAVGSATGDLDDGVPARTVCVAYVFPDGSTSNDQTTRLVTAADGTTTETVGSDCFSDGRPGAERRVQVTVSRETDFMVLFFDKTVTLDAESAVRFERSS